MAAVWMHGEEPGATSFGCQGWLGEYTGGRVQGAMVDSLAELGPSRSDPHIDLGCPCTREAEKNHEPGQDKVLLDRHQVLL